MSDLSLRVAGVLFESGPVPGPNATVEQTELAPYAQLSFATVPLPKAWGSMKSDDDATSDDPDHRQQEQQEEERKEEEEQEQQEQQEPLECQPFSVRPCKLCPSWRLLSRIC